MTDCRPTKLMFTFSTAAGDKSDRLAGARACHTNSGRTPLLSHVCRPFIGYYCNMTKARIQILHDSISLRYTYSNVSICGHMHVLQYYRT